MILIYTFITETVNCPERIIQLHALQHVTVFLCKLGVQHIQHGSVHFKNLILVVSECHIEIGRKLTGLIILFVVILNSQPKFRILPTFL